MLRNLPIQFIIPAFPFKSRNTESKVLGVLPDKGEELALLTLNSFIDKVTPIYPKGAHLTIISDGRVFADDLDVKYENVSKYNAEL